MAIFTFYSLNYSFTARLQDNSRPKIGHKGRDKEKITAIYCLWMVDSERGREWQLKKENVKTKITFNIKCQYNYQPLFA